MFRLLFASALVLGSLICAQAQDAAPSNPFDNAPLREAAHAADTLARPDNPFRALETLQVDAPFANLPFLRLRVGDRLVRGQLFSHPTMKGDPPADATWSAPDLWLARDESADQIAVNQRGERVELSNPAQLPHFAWEPTLGNADALFEFWRNAQPARSVSLAQLRQLDTVLQADYAEYESERLSQFLAENPQFAPGFQRQTGSGDDQKWVYAGLSYRPKEGVYQYRWTLGNRGWSEERAPLIEVPFARSNASRFVREVPAIFRSSLPLDATRRIEAQDKRLTQFYALVEGVLDAPPSASATN